MNILQNCNWCKDVIDLRLQTVTVSLSPGVTSVIPFHFHEQTLRLPLRHLCRVSSDKRRLLKPPCFSFKEPTR